MIKKLLAVLCGFFVRKSVRCNNIMECVCFVIQMKQHVLGMKRVIIVKSMNVSEGLECYLSHTCIDYGLIFSASNKIQRYVVFENGFKAVLREDEIVIPCTLMDTVL